MIGTGLVQNNNTRNFEGQEPAMTPQEVNAMLTNPYNHGITINQTLNTSMLSFALSSLKDTNGEDKSLSQG